MGELLGSINCMVYVYLSVGVSGFECNVVVLGFVYYVDMVVLCMMVVRLLDDFE